MEFTIQWLCNFEIPGTFTEQPRTFFAGQQIRVRVEVNGFWTLDGVHLHGAHEAEHFIFVREET